MSILSILLLGFALVILVLLILNVPVSQRAINILFIIIILLLIVANGGWVTGLGFK